MVGLVKRLRGEVERKRKEGSIESNAPPFQHGPSPLTNPTKAQKPTQPYSSSPSPPIEDQGGGS